MLSDKNHEAAQRWKFTRDKMNRLSASEFLKTGLLEQYVLDLLPSAERSEVEWYIVEYPEVKTAHQEILSALNSMGKAPKIKKLPFSPPSPSTPIKKDAALQTTKSNLLGKFSLFNVLTLGLIATLAFLWYKANQSLAIERANAGEALADCEQKEKRHQAILDFYILPQTQPVVLEGNEMLPGFRSTAYYNKGTGQMSIILAESNQIPSNKCLYLWGDVHGEMVKITKIKPHHNHEYIIPFNSETESFNFTLEDMELEVDHPTVSQLIASANI